MTDNPYASPSTEPGVATNIEPVPKQFLVASQGKRFVNMIVDTIMIQVFGFVVGMIYVVLRFAANGTLATEDDTWIQIAGFVVRVMVALGYFVIMESLFQRTLAKFLTRTLVVNANGARPSFGQIVGRSFARFIPFEAFSFLDGKYPVGLHDSLSGTHVVTVSVVGSHDSPMTHSPTLVIDHQQGPPSLAIPVATNSWTCEECGVVTPETWKRCSKCGVPRT